MNEIRLNRLGILAAMLLGTLNGAVAEAQPQYIARDLGTIPGAVGHSWAGDLNEVGEACGFADAPNGRSIHALRWDGAHVVDLGTLGGTYSWAYGINNSAQIVGYSFVNSLRIHGYIWEDGAMFDIGSLPGSRGTFSRANAINESGLLAGACHGTGSGMVVPYAGFVYDHGDWTEIPTFGGTESQAFGINDAGDAVGWARFAEPNSTAPRAFLFRGGNLIDIGTLGGNRSQGWAINNAGVVAGGSTDGDGKEHAFTWHEGGALEALPELGGAESKANDLNERGQVVGWSNDVDGVQRGVLWDDGRVWDLNEIVEPGTGAFFHGAAAINELGQILVTGTYENDLKRIFLLTPINMPVLSGPEPGFAGAWNEITVTNLEPGARVFLAASLGAGSMRVPGCPLSLNVRGGQIVTSAIADEQGKVRWRVYVPGSLSGQRIFMQALDRTNCAGTNLVRHAFE